MRFLTRHEYIIISNFVILVSNDSVEDSSGVWDTDGCFSMGETEDGAVTCHCNHFTNFALLLSPAGQHEEAPPELTIISTIGAILSLIGMSFTAIAHCGLK